jgi:hypothetical protein
MSLLMYEGRKWNGESVFLDLAVNKETVIASACVLGTCIVLVAAPLLAGC